MQKSLFFKKWESLKVLKFKRLLTSKSKPFEPKRSKKNLEFAREVFQIEFHLSRPFSVYRMHILLWVLIT